MKRKQQLCDFLKLVSIKIDSTISSVNGYIKSNAQLIIILIIGALAAYGFELFNFNLTIDEEVYAFSYGPNPGWIGQGRWGMYILNKIFLPYSSVPVVPLFLALAFHLFSILLILDGWEVKSTLDRALIGMINITFPTIAYAYTFSTFNYGIGFGFLCIGLSIYQFKKHRGWIKFLAVIPAAFAVGIYQGFILALLAVLLVDIISLGLNSKKLMAKDLLNIFVIVVGALLTYFIAQKLVIYLSRIDKSEYLLNYIHPGSLFGNLKYILNQIWSTIQNVYLGKKSIYSINIPMLGVLSITLLVGFVIGLIRSHISLVNKIMISFFLVVLIVLPFSIDFLSGGNVPIRVYVALPIVVSGFGMLGLGNNLKVYKFLVTIIACFCFLQFFVSTNHLFTSSYLSLQEDRLLAAQLIDKIQEEKASGVEAPKYLEIIGYITRPETELMPKIETFGSSFFEWDQGNIHRVLLFLQTVGYDDLSALPGERRAEFIPLGEVMPQWPDKGSVKVIGDTVLVKFSAYSSYQKRTICSNLQELSANSLDIDTCVIKMFVN